jgi:hypothetical protein
MGGQRAVYGTDPEQLVRHWLRSLLPVRAAGGGRGRKLNAGDSKITAWVGLGPTGHGGFGLAVTLDLHAPYRSWPRPQI